MIYDQMIFDLQMNFHIYDCQLGMQCKPSVPHQIPISLVDIHIKAFRSFLH